MYRVAGAVRRMLHRQLSGAFEKWQREAARGVEEGRWLAVARTSEASTACSNALQLWHSCVFCRSSATMSIILAVQHHVQYQLIHALMTWGNRCLRRCRDGGGSSTAILCSSTLVSLLWRWHGWALSRSASNTNLALAASCHVLGSIWIALKTLRSHASHSLVQQLRCMTSMKGRCHMLLRQVWESWRALSRAKVQYQDHIMLAIVRSWCQMARDRRRAQSARLRAATAYVYWAFRDCMQTWRQHRITHRRHRSASPPPRHGSPQLRQGFGSTSAHQSPPGTCHIETPKGGSAPEHSPSQSRSTEQPAAAAAREIPDFDLIDANCDGVIDRAEWLLSQDNT